MWLCGTRGDFTIYLVLESESWKQEASHPTEEFRAVSSSQVPTYPQIRQALRRQRPVTLHILPSINVQKSLLKQHIGARDVGVVPSVVAAFDATAVFVAVANHVAAAVPTSGVR
ncbi:hypothetical protein TIFTF001_013957 [Ficus carica]|uniref:Uncharacterized protein n=1 Tax=Ficus carica TaxID=3494 RepID=A0AA88D7R1_FICCA|nr:hypothetical protein TIFTF001_013957 [Ficus carica]